MPGIRLIMKLRVASVEMVTPEVAHLVLVHPTRPKLPSWTAGAHIDLQLPNGQSRQYSLCGDPANEREYHIAVKLEAEGRGGSQWVHSTLVAETLVPVAAPRNNFPIAENGARHILIAGGIGVTPMLAMARSLTADGADFAVHFCARSIERAPLLAQLREVCGDRLRCWFSVDGDRFSMEAIGPPNEGEHIYVCGPNSLMDTVASGSPHLGWSPENIHCERFEPAHDPLIAAKPFKVKIASSGEILEVPAETTMLRVLHEAGFKLHSSCETGVCGSCECGYLGEGAIHRDVVIKGDQKHSRITPCVSRAKDIITLLL